MANVQNHRENKKMDQAIIFGIIVAVTLIVVYSSFTIIPTHHVGIWIRFGAILNGNVSKPGLYITSPVTGVVTMFTGPDNDEGEYTCGSYDGIMFKGKYVIGNRLKEQCAKDSYSIYGKHPDDDNIKGMTVIIIQDICANMTARQFLSDKYTLIDDLVEKQLKKHQVIAKSCLEILPGKVKIYKPVPTNSDIADIIKKEAEHRQSARTAVEKQKLNKKQAELAAAKQEAEEQLARERNRAIEQRKTDSIEAEKIRQQIQHEMDTARAYKEYNVTTIAAKARAAAKAEDAKANALWITPELIKLKAIEAFNNNSKFIIGDSIPKAWVNAEFL